MADFMRCDIGVATAMVSIDLAATMSSNAAGPYTTNIVRLLQVQERRLANDDIRPRGFLRQAARHWSVACNHARACRCASAISRAVMSSEMSARHNIAISLPLSAAKLKNLCASIKSTFTPPLPVEYATPRSYKASAFPRAASKSRLSIRKFALFILLAIILPPHPL